MNAVETMAKAAWDEENGFGAYELVSAISQKKLQKFARAALLALAEAEIPRDIISNGLNAYIIADGTTNNDIDESQAFHIGLKAILRALAEQP